MRADNPDLVVHLGDYIYESSWGDPVRRHEGPEPLDLDHYRMRHALYKSDPHLQAMHAACPWLVTWDDHEVQNDYAADVAEDGTPPTEFVKRRAAAYRAYWEHLPLRLSQLLYAGNMALFNANVWGDLATFAVMDTRQYRSPEACPIAPDRRGGHLAVDGTCAELALETRSMLGADQERWLGSTMRRSAAKWNVLAQSVLFAGMNQKNAQGQHGSWTDVWDGYPAARRRILDAIEKLKVANPIVLTGDIHSFWANEVKKDHRVADSPALGVEFVSGSITSQGVDYAMFQAMMPDNPHVKFFESRVRGYALCEVSQAQWRTNFRTVANVRDPATKGGTLGTWVVEAGKPGVHKA
jgi:alkaline phosphatase D